MALCHFSSFFYSHTLCIRDEDVMIKLDAIYNLSKAGNRTKVARALTLWGKYNKSIAINMNDTNKRILILMRHLFLMSLFATSMEWR